MNVLLVTNDYPPRPGGIQQFWAGVVASHPGSLRVLAPAASGPAPGDVVRHERRFMLPTRAVRRWVEAEARRAGADVLLFGAPHPLAFLGPALRRALRIPYAVMCHGAEITIPAAFPGARQALRRPLAAADALFAVSEFTARKVRALTGAAVATVGAGVDTAAFHPGPGAPAAGFVIGCVSRFVPRKGQTRLLRAAARLRSAGGDVSVVLVGKGRKERHLRRLAKRLGVPCRFEIDVPWSRLPDLYRSMDAFCMPCRSRWFGLEAEGLGIVYLEAAATGLPVVAGTSGGAPETVVAGRTGYVAASVDHVAEALARLAGDRSRAKEMGNEGRRRVTSEYVWGGVADRLEAGLQQAVAGFEADHRRK